MRALLVVGLISALLAGAACGSRPPGGAVLYSAGVSDDQALTDVRGDLLGWAQETSGRQISNLGQTVSCRAPNAFGARLRAAVEPFELVQIACYSTNRFAPVIVVESDHYVQLARALTGIANLSRGRGNRFPIFVEAVDSRGIPYSTLISTVTISGSVIGSGWVPWSRANALWPCGRCHVM